MSATRALTAAALTLSATLAALTGWAMAVRLVYPFELEWMEGGMVVHVARLLAGEPVYAAPSLSFVPFGYPPLYYYVAMLPSAIMGPGLMPLRLVSIAATVVTVAAVYVIARPLSGRAGAAIGAGAYAGAYSLTDGWFDVGRVDSLYVGLLAATVATAVRAQQPWHWMAAGSLAAAAFAAKQPALIAVAPFLLYLAWTDRRAALRFVVALAAVSAVFTGTHMAATGGWYTYYVFELPRLRLAVAAGSGRLLSFWTADLLPVGIALVAGATGMVRLKAWRLGSLLAGLVLSAWLSRLEGGAWNNAVMPAYLAAAVLLAVALHPAGAALAARTAAAVIQLALLLYDPRAHVPTAADHAAGAALVERLRSAPAPLLVLDHGHWPTLAGKAEHAHGWAVTDVVWADRGPVGVRLEAEIRDALRRQAFAAVVLDDERAWFYQDVEGSYVRAGEIDAPQPPSGAPRRPRYIYTPRRVAQKTRISATMTMPARMATDHHDRLATLFISPSCRGIATCWPGGRAGGSDEDRRRRAPEQGGDDRGERQVLPQGRIGVGLVHFRFHGPQPWLDPPGLDGPVVIVSASQRRLRGLSRGVRPREASRLPAAVARFS